MKECYASFPPIKASKTMVIDPAPVETPTITANGYNYSSSTNNRFKAGHEIRIDLRGLTIADKLLKINSIHMARMPSFDNTFPKSEDPARAAAGGIYQIIDMHLVTTSPIVYNASVADAGIAPAQNEVVQLESTTEAFGSTANNNGYALPTPGLLQGGAGALDIDNLNLDPNMIVFCQTDVLTGNVRSNANLQSMLVPIDSSVYGMGDLAALETLHCYRFVYGEWTSNTAVPAFAGVIQANIGPSIIQMNTEVQKPSDIIRLSVMDQNFNTTNPLLE